MQVIELKAENFKRLTAVRIVPEGHLIGIGGENGAGKTSVLDAIMAALGGAKAAPSEPVRKGAKKASLFVDLGDVTVERTFKPDGSGSVIVRGKDGVSMPSPQAVLDRLVGKLSFDPLAFQRLKPAEQREALRQLLGLDFSKLDAAREKAFAERTDVNRQLKSAQAQLDAAPFHPDAPDEPVSTEDLTARIAEINEHNAYVAKIAREKRDLEDGLIAKAKRREALRAELEHLDESILEDQKSLTELQDECLESGELKSPDAIKAEVQAADWSNRQFEQNQEHARLSKSAQNLEAKSQALTEEIASVDQRKRDMLEAANMPIKGLSFDETGVRYRDVPLSQCSAAEAMRVSVAMGIAMNPTLRVLLVRDGSLLDSKSLKIVTEMAEAADAQVWLERVGDGAECQVVIEDGHVRESVSV